MTPAAAIICGSPEIAAVHTTSFLHSSDGLRVIVFTVAVQRWTDAEKELEGVAETIAIIAIESLWAIVDGELRPEANVETVPERVRANGKDARVCRGV